MQGILLAFIIYFIIAIGIYIGINMGTFDLEIQSKATGEWVEPGTGEYEVLKLIFSMSWIVMAIQTIARGSDRNGQNS